MQGYNYNDWANPTTVVFVDCSKYSCASIELDSLIQF